MEQQFELTVEQSLENPFSLVASGNETQCNVSKLMEESKTKLDNSTFQEQRYHLKELLQFYTKLSA